MTQYITFKPSKVSLSHKYRTTIQKTLNGSEKRSAILTYPRISMDVSYSFVDHPKSMWLKSRLYHYMDELWGIPVWPDYTTVTSTASGSQSTINVGSAQYRHFYANRKAILINKDDWKTYEVITLSGVGTTSLTVSGVLTSSWAVGSYVMPVYECRIDPAQTVARKVRDFDTIKITADEAYESQNTFTYTIPTTSGIYTTYSGADVFTPIPSVSVDYVYQHPYELNQWWGIGSTETYYEETYLPIKARYIVSNKSDVWNWYQFFDGHMGRLTAFWVPSWNKDIVLTAGVTSSGTTLNIQNIEYTTYWLPNQVVGRHLYIRLPNKSYVIRKVTAATTSSLTISSALGTAITDYGNCYISFLHYARFDIDEFDVEYHTNGTVARTQINFMGLLESEL